MAARRVPSAASRSGLDGPLDMWIGAERSQPPTVTGARPRTRSSPTSSILFGEERHSRAVACAIVAARKEAPIETTQALADIVAKVVRAKPGEIHPATRTFQALRIFANEELARAASGASPAERVLQARRTARRGLVPFARGPSSVESFSDRVSGRRGAGSSASAGSGRRRRAELAQPRPGRPADRR